VQTECARGKDQNKLVAVERVALTADDVPALFYLVDRKRLTDFTGDIPHEGWAMALSALATKLRLWAERFPDHADCADVLAKADLLDKAADAERAGLAGNESQSRPGARAPTPTAGAAEQAWTAIERSLDASHYRRFERTFETDPNAFVRVIEAEARAKALERWEATDKANPEAIAETMRTGLFPALQEAAQAKLDELDRAAHEAAATEACRKAELAAQARARAAVEFEARRKADEQARAAAAADAQRKAEAAKAKLEAEERQRAVETAAKNKARDRLNKYRALVGIERTTDAQLAEFQTSVKRETSVSALGLALVSPGRNANEDGDIVARDVVIHKDAVVEGDIVAEVVEVGGRVEGNTYARRVRLRTGCYVAGDISHSSLSVEMGVVFEGQVRYLQNPLTTE